MFPQGKHSTEERLESRVIPFFCRHIRSSMGQVMATLTISR